MRRNHRQASEELERSARQTGDIRPLSSTLRREWEAAKRTAAKNSKPRHRPKLTGSVPRIVPISLDPLLLERVDRYAKSTGVSRSTLVAEGLRLRIKP